MGGVVSLAAKPQTQLDSAEQAGRGRLGRLAQLAAVVQVALVELEEVRLHIEEPEREVRPCFLQGQVEEAVVVVLELLDHLWVLACVLTYDSLRGDL